MCTVGEDQVVKKVDADRLTRAFDFGRDAHDGQTRASGEPYFTHPIAVANILADMRLDEESIITALLHDTVEDCGVTLDMLDGEFGGDVAQLVDGVTKLSRLAIKTLPSSAQAENFRKLLLAMSEDVRVLLVKLADRTHNMRTLSFIPKPEKQIRIARETMDIYAPLAERIGLTQIQNELEESAFEVLHGEMRQSILTRLEFLTSEAKITIPTISVELEATLETARGNTLVQELAFVVLVLLPGDEQGVLLAGDFQVGFAEASHGHGDAVAVVFYQFHIVGRVAGLAVSDGGVEQVGHTVKADGGTVKG